MRKNIVFGFSRPRKFTIGSFLIRVFQGWTPYSHVFVSWEVTELEFDCIFEAWGHDVSFRSPLQFQERSQVVASFNVQVSPEALIKIRRKAHLLQGTPYAMLENAGIAVAKTLGFLLRRPIKNPFGVGRKRFKCSELSLDLLDDIKELGLDYELDLDLVDVKDVFNVLRELSLKKGDLVTQMSEFKPKW